MVEQTVKALTGVSLERKPVAYLLHGTLLSSKSYKNSLLKDLLTAAKACIPALWKSQATLIKSYWLARITEIQMSMTEQSEKFWRIWTPYFLYEDQSPLVLQG